MRRLILAAAMAAIAMPAAVTPADARGRSARGEARRCGRELRDAHNLPEYRMERRECARELSRPSERDWRTYDRYDYDRPPPGGRYYADDYYRDGRHYRERRLSADDRIYRGRDGRYYCRRDDGTTGLIVGADTGALIGNALDNGRSSTLGTLLGAAAVTGGAIGRDLRCR